MTRGPIVRRLGALLLAAGVTLAGAGLVAPAASADPGDIPTVSAAPDLPRSLDLSAGIELGDGSALYLAQSLQTSPPVGERYTPSTGKWSDIAPEPTTRYGGQLIALTDGDALLIGGNTESDGTGVAVPPAVFHSNSDSWTEYPNATVGSGSFVTLSDGDELLQNGQQRFHPASGSFTATAAMPAGDDNFNTAAGLHVVAQLPGDRALAVDYQRDAYIYDATADTWSRTVAEPQDYTSFVRLQDGDVLGINGSVGGYPLPAIYSPQSNAWRQVADPTAFAYGASSAVAADGEVVVTELPGSSYPGYDPTPLKVYDPLDDAWNEVGPAGVSGGLPTALGDGTVLLTDVSASDPAAVDVVSLSGGPVQRSTPSQNAAKLLAVHTGTAVAGQPDTVTARLSSRSDGLPLSGEEVDLYSRPDGSTNFTKITSGTTDKLGGVTFAPTFNGATDYQLRHPASEDADAAGTGVLVVPVSVPPSAPGPPSAVRATPGDGEVLVEWLPPATATADPVTSYTVSAAPTTFTLLALQQSKTVAANALSTVLSPLTNGVAYTVTVVANTSSGSGQVQSTATPQRGLTQPSVRAGTLICGDITASITWSAAASPYTLCSLGATIDAGVTVTVDGSAGPVAVNAEPDATLTVAGALVSSGPVGSTTFDRAVATQDWNGVQLTSPCYVLRCASTNPYGDVGGANLSLVDLDSSVTLAHAATAIGSSRYAGGAVELTGTTISDSSGNGIDLHATALSVTGASITGNAGIGIHDAVSYGDDTTPDSVTDSSFVDNGLQGVVLATSATPVLRGNSFDGNGVVQGLPAAEVDAALLHLSGTATDVADNTGAGNGHDAVALSGDVVESDTWQPYSDSSAGHPLGWLGQRVIWGAGTTLTLPQGGTVVGNIGIYDATLDASAGGIVVDGSLFARGFADTMTLTDDTVTGEVSDSDPQDYDEYEFYYGFWDDSTSRLSVTNSTVGAIASIAALTLTGSQVGQLQASNGNAGPISIDSTNFCSVPFTGQLADSPMAALSVWSYFTATVSVHDIGFNGCSLPAMNIHAPDPLLQNIDVRNSASGGTWTLDSGAVGPGARVELPTGSGNAADQIELAGTMAGALTVETAANSPLEHPLRTDFVGLTLTDSLPIVFTAGNVTASQLLVTAPSFTIEPGAQIGPVADPSTPYGPEGIRFTTTPSVTPSAVTIDQATVGVPLTLNGSGATQLPSLSITNSSLAQVSAGATDVTITNDTGSGTWNLYAGPSLHVDQLALTGSLASLTASMTDEPAPVAIGQPQNPTDGPASDLVFTHVSVSGSSSSEPAVTLSGVRAGMGSGQQIDDVTGSSDTVPVLYLNDDTILGGATWVTPRASSVIAPLGYHWGGVDVEGGGVTLPAGAVAKISQLTLSDGATFDATAGGATITGPGDNTAGLVCASCLFNGTTASITDAVAGGAPSYSPGGGISIADATVNGSVAGAGASSSPGSDSFGFTVVNSTVQTLSATGERAEFSGVHTAEMFVSSSSHSTLLNVAVDQQLPGGGVVCCPFGGVNIDDSQVYVHGLTASHPGIPALVEFDPLAGSVLECLDIAGSTAGGRTSDGLLIAGGSDLEIRDSDLTGDATPNPGGYPGPTYDVSNRGFNYYPGNTTATIDTTGDWWGQTGGPVAGQIFGVADVDTAPASARAGCPAVDPALVTGPMPAPVTGSGSGPSASPSPSSPSPSASGSTTASASASASPSPVLPTSPVSPVAPTSTAPATVSSGTARPTPTLSPTPSTTRSPAGSAPASPGTMPSPSSHQTVASTATPVPAATLSAAAIAPLVLRLTAPTSPALPGAKNTVTGFVTRSGAGAAGVAISVAVTDMTTHKTTTLTALSSVTGSFAISVAPRHVAVLTAALPLLPSTRAVMTTLKVRPAASLTARRILGRAAINVRSGIRGRLTIAVYAVDARGRRHRLGYWRPRSSGVRTVSYALPAGTRAIALDLPATPGFSAFTLTTRV